MATGRFADRVGIVTGGAAGIGRATSEAWFADGGIVAIADMDGDHAQALALELDPSGKRAAGWTLDVTDLESIKAFVPAVVKRFGGIDALFNVAGNNSMKNVEEAEDDEWRFIIDVNLMSIYRLSKYCIPEMRKRGGGSIVNVASIAGVLAENRCSAYSATKAAVINLSKNMAMDFAKDHIRVNTLCPGGTMTPRIRGYMAANPGHEAIMTSLCAMGRMAEPQEMAKPMVFLASDDASFITGAALMVDGGYTAGKHISLFDDPA